MTKKTCIIILVLLSFILNADIKKEKSIKRFVFAIGANNGGSDRIKLQYAISDAASFLKVLKEIGGVFDDDTFFLKNPTKKVFLSSLKELSKKIKHAKLKFQRVETIFYYSGHSDDQSILLGEEKISYAVLNKKINKTPVDVRIAILDSCASGSFIRQKGGKYKSPFMIDTANNMKGYAIMTSSSSDEASQESDKIKGSYFTHNLISGLRGAADMSKDGKVTLNEVYQYAFNETLSQTESSLSGPQHPNYNIQMSGTGDVIMTDVKKSSALLLLGKELHGKVFVWDKNKKLVLELSKITGTKIFIGLNKGLYKFINIRNDKVYMLEANLEIGKTFNLTTNLFRKVKKSFTRSRGGIPIVTVNDFKKISFFAGIESRTLYILGSNNVGGMGYLGIKLKNGIYISLFSLIPEKDRNFYGLSFNYGFNIIKKMGLDLGLKIGELSGFNEYNLFNSGNVTYGFNEKKYIALEIDLKIRYKLSKNTFLLGGVSLPMSDIPHISYGMPSISFGLRWIK